MQSGFKLIVPCTVALCLAAACMPDLDSLSAEYSASAGTSGGGNAEGGMPGGSGNAGAGTAGMSGGAPVDACDNGSKDSNESDVDCGGTSQCKRCDTGGLCTA